MLGFVGSGPVVWFGQERRVPTAPLRPTTGTYQGTRQSGGLKPWSTRSSSARAEVPPLRRLLKDVIGPVVR